MFCQLNLRRSRVSFKRAKDTLVIVLTEGLVVMDEFGNDQVMPSLEATAPSCRSHARCCHGHSEAACRSNMPALPVQNMNAFAS